MEKVPVDSVVGFALVTKKYDPRGVRVKAVVRDLMGEVGAVARFFEVLETALIQRDDVGEFPVNGNGDGAGEDFVKDRADGDGSVVNEFV